jgi:hypothetical protein
MKSSPFIILLVIVSVFGAIYAGSADKSGLQGLGFIIFIVGALITWPILRTLEKSGEHNTSPGHQG